MTWDMAGEIASAVLLLGGTGYMILRALKERKARKVGMKANPTRCIDAEKRIRALEICEAETKVKLDGIDDKLDSVASDVKDLIRLHVKP